MQKMSQTWFLLRIIWHQSDKVCADPWICMIKYTLPKGALDRNNLVLRNRYRVETIPLPRLIIDTFSLVSVPNSQTKKSLCSYAYLCWMKEFKYEMIRVHLLKILRIFPHEIQKIILREMKLNIVNLQKLEFRNFSDVWYNLIMCGLNLIS